MDFNKYATAGEDSIEIEMSLCPICNCDFSARGATKHYCVNKHAHCGECVAKMVQTCSAGCCSSVRWSCSICRVEVENLLASYEDCAVLRGVSESLLKRVSQLVDEEDDDT